MEYLELLDLDIDLTCSNQDNIITEEIEITDKTLPFIVPTYQPFYGKDFKIKGDITGNINVTNGYPKDDTKGFSLLGPDVEYNEIIGQEKGIWTFGILDQETLKENNSVKITYRTVGARYLPLRYYESSMKEIEDNAKSVDWDMIFKKPDTFIPQDHIHSVYEITNWTEVMWWIGYMSGLLKRVYSPNTFSLSELEESFDELWLKLFNMRDDYNKILIDHNENYDHPHKITKETLGLGHVDNFPMAATTEDIGEYFVDSNIAYGIIKKNSVLDTDSIYEYNNKYLVINNLPITTIKSNHKYETVVPSDPIISLDLNMNIMGKDYSYKEININLATKMNVTLKVGDKVYLYLRPFGNDYYPVFSLNTYNTNNRFIFIREYEMKSGNTTKGNTFTNIILDGYDMNPDYINTHKGRIIPCSTSDKGTTIYLDEAVRYKPRDYTYTYNNYGV